MTETAETTNVESEMDELRDLILPVLDFYPPSVITGVLVDIIAQVISLLPPAMQQQRLGEVMWLLTHLSRDYNEQIRGQGDAT
jgi:hypothetical protein